MNQILPNSINMIADNLYYNGGVWYSKTIKDISYTIEGHDIFNSIEKSSYWFLHRNNCIVELVNKYCSNGIIYDVGGGNGFVAQALVKNGIITILIEPGIQGIKNAEERNLKYLICSSFEDAGFKENSLDSIGLFDVLEHIKDDKEFLKLLFNSIKNNGYIYLTVPSYNYLWSKEDELAGHYRRYSLKNIVELLNEVGFIVVYSSYIFSYLVVPILLFRSVLSKIKYYKQSRDLITAQHNPSKIIGIIVSYFSKKEINTIKKNKRIIFGSSCIIVASKVIKYE
jgi:2-polyprenyl-3-methyl-5-hydroxy-6-metoxy-1,4-benzoquinol methylase